jgi:hypothetical protein
MEYIDQRFEGTTVQLDGNTFRNCSFLDVLFQYAGGPLEMSDCAMDRIRFQFGGDLAQGLHMLYQLFGTEGMLTILRGFLEPAPGEITLPER